MPTEDVGPADRTHGPGCFRCCTTERLGAVLADAARSGTRDAFGFLLTIGDVKSFARSKQIDSYLGLIPSESSSGGKQRMGAIIRQVNRLLRVPLVEAAN